MSAVMELELTPSWELCNCATGTQLALMHPLGAGAGTLGQCCTGESRASRWPSLKHGNKGMALYVFVSMPLFILNAQTYH